MTNDLHALTGAFALDALDEAERRAFADHLGQCDSCAEEIAGLLATSAMLGIAAATTAPDSLHRAVMTEVRATRQLPPLGEETDAGRVVPMLRRARTTSRALLAVAAALVVVAGTLGGIAIQEQRRATAIEQAASEVANVLAAPDARTVKGHGPGGSSARVIVSDQRDAAVFVGSSLPPVDDQQVLQLWVLSGDTARSVGLLEGTQPIVAHGVTRAARLGVTVEPAGGSEKPTTPPVMELSLA